MDARLQAQVEPHFLFNTLQALVESNSPRAAGVLQCLIAYLRAAMPRLHEREANLGDELTLVENAVRHGIDPSEVGGRIEVGAEVAEQGLRLWVHDNGVGISELSQPGLGLANLRARLAEVLPVSRSFLHRFRQI